MWTRRRERNRECLKGVEYSLFRIKSFLVSSLYSWDKRECPSLDEFKDWFNLFLTHGTVGHFVCGLFLYYGWHSLDALFLIYSMLVTYQKNQARERLTKLIKLNRQQPKITGVYTLDPLRRAPASNSHMLTPALVAAV